MRVEEPDPRLRDVELLLRLVAWRRYSTDYRGNMKPFLDDTMKRLNSRWNDENEEVGKLTADILKGVEVLNELLGNNVGRRIREGDFQPQLNRALFEVETYYFSFSNVRRAASGRKTEFLKAFKALFRDTDFVGSVESTTKSIENYRIRFGAFGEMLRRSLNVRLKPFAIGANS